MRLLIRNCALLVLLGMQSACVATAVNAAVDTTIAVAKVPFKVGGAAVDVLTPDKDEDED